MLSYSGADSWLSQFKCVTPDALVNILSGLVRY